MLRYILILNIMVLYGCGRNHKERDFFKGTQESYHFTDSIAYSEGYYRKLYENFGISKKSILNNGYHYYQLKNDTSGLFNLNGYIKKENSRILFINRLGKTAKEQLLIDFNPIGKRWKIYQNDNDTTSYLEIRYLRRIRLESIKDSVYEFYMKRKEYRNPLGEAGIFFMVHKDFGFVHFTIFARNRTLGINLYPKSFFVKVKEKGIRI